MCGGISCAPGLHRLPGLRYQLVLNSVLEGVPLCTIGSPAAIGLSHIRVIGRYDKKGHVHLPAG